MYGIKNAGMQVLKMSINVQVLQKLFINIKKKASMILIDQLLYMFLMLNKIVKWLFDKLEIIVLMFLHVYVYAPLSFVCYTLNRNTIFHLFVKISRKIMCAF